MKLIFSTPLGCGRDYGPSMKCAGAAIAEGVAGTIIGGLFDQLKSNEDNARMKRQMRLQNLYNKDEMAYSQALNKDYQMFLNNTQYGAQVSGMRNAGLNPAGASTSIGAMQGSNSLHTGSSAPSPIPSSIGNKALQGAEVGLQAANAQADIDVKKAQADNIKADTEDKKFRNTPGYRAKILAGMDADTANAWASAEEHYQNVKIGIAKEKEIDQNIEESISRMNLNEDQREQVKAKTIETIVSCKAILVGMSEVESRIAVNRTIEDLNREKGKTERSKRNLINEQAKTEDEKRMHSVDERKTMSYERDEISARVRTEGSKQELMSEQTKQSKLDQKSRELSNKLQEYRNEVEMYTPASTRAAQEQTRNMWATVFAGITEMPFGFFLNKLGGSSGRGSSYSANGYSSPVTSYGY